MANYLTPAEYRYAPTAVDTYNLVPNTGAADQDAALSQIIARASGWIDNTCNQPLIAASRVDVRRTRYNKYAELSIHPAHTPLNQLIGLSIGTDASNLAAISAASLTQAWINEGNFQIPSSTGAGFVPYQLGGARGTWVLASMTSVSGWPNTKMTSNPTAAATSFTVASAVGFTPQLGSDVQDMSVVIYDGSKTETITITSVAGSTINCSALAFAHSAGAVVSGLPPEVKEAAILATSAFIKTRGMEALTSTNLTMMPSQVNPGWDAPRSAALRDAKQILSSYARVR